MHLPFELLCTDFDGTIHAEGENPPVPPSLQALISDLQARGVKWVINTGRDLPGLVEAMARAKVVVCPDYLVLVEREVYVREGPRFASLDSWNRRCGEAHAQLFERVRPDVPRLSAWISERFDVLIYADVWSPLCIVAKDNQDADAIQQYLDEYCRQVENLCLVRNDVYARLGHLHFNKGTALAQIGRHAGVHPERVLVAGDHLNDLPMLSPRYARWLVAPANAIPAVKQAVLSAGGHVSPLPCGYGVERALDLLLEDYLEED